MSHQTITTWIGKMQAGDPQAVAHLWEICWQPVVWHARAMLHQRFRAVSDEEDIAAAVLESVFLGAQAGNYHALNNSNAFWRLLWVVVERKVARHVEYHLASRRNVNKTVHLSSLKISDTSFELSSDTQDRPLESVALAESLEQLMSQLDAPTMRTAKLALEGKSPKEIAERLGVKAWAIYSQLSLIRKLLKQAQND